MPFWAFKREVFSLVGNILHCTKGHKRKREKVKGDYWCVYLVYVFDESPWKDICVTRIFLLCPIQGFMCNNKSNNIEDLEDQTIS